MAILLVKKEDTFGGGNIKMKKSIKLSAVALLLVISFTTMALVDKPIKRETVNNMYKREVVIKEENEYLPLVEEAIREDYSLTGRFYIKVEQSRGELKVYAYGEKVVQKEIDSYMNWISSHYGEAKK